MNNRAYALLAGAFVLLLGAAAIAVAVWLGGSRQGTDPYVVVTEGSVTGLRPQSPVLFRGIVAGRVDSIAFDPANPARILVRVALDRGVPVSRATYAQLRLLGLTGGAQLELDNEPGPAAREPLRTSAAHPAEIPLRPSAFQQITASGAVIAARLGALAASLDALLNAANRRHLDRLIAQADAASAELVGLERDLDATARQLPALAGQSRRTLAELERLARNLNALSRQAGRLAASGQTAGARLTGQTLPRLDTALAEISAAAAQVRRLAESLQRNPQQLLQGPAHPPPGPGEAGYREPPR